MTNQEKARDTEARPAPEDAKQEGRASDLSITKEHLKDLSLTGDGDGMVKGGVPKSIDCRGDR